MGQSFGKLIDVITSLKKIDFSKEYSEINKKDEFICDSIKDLIYINKDTLLSSKKEFEKSFSNYSQEVNNLVNRLQKNLTDVIPAFLNQNSVIFQTQFERMTFEEQLEWHTSQPPKLINLENFIMDMKMHMSWQYPILIYGNKNSSSFLKKLFGFDPIYVMEYHPEYFDLYRKSYHPDEVKKFQFYSWDEKELLPKHSIGYIIIYNEFPYKRLDQIENMLKYFISILHPGGNIIFNYNDCSTGKNFSMFEQKIMTYNSFKIMQEMVSKLGLTITNSESMDIDYFSWMSCQLPGNLPNIKKFPSLGKINRKDEILSPTTLDLHKTYIKRAILNYNIDSENKKQ